MKLKLKWKSVYLRSHVRLHTDFSKFHQSESLKLEIEMIGMWMLMRDKEWHGSWLRSVFSAAKNTVRVKWLPAPLWDMSVLKGMETPSHLFLHHLSINRQLFTCSVLIHPCRLSLFWHPQASKRTARFSKSIPNTRHRCHLCSLPEPNLGRRGGWILEGAEVRWISSSLQLGDTTVSQSKHTFQVLMLFELRAKFQNFLTDALEIRFWDHRGS